MYQWEDGTVSHYIRYRRSVWPPSSVIMKEVHTLQIVTSSSRNRHLVCEKEKVFKTLTAENGFSGKPQFQLPEIDSDSVSFPHVVCSSGHYTHRFLACDAQSHCMQRDPSGQGSGSDETLTAVCKSILDTLFTCRNGVEHVPYSLVCDHSQDCFDSSDEDICVHPPCSGGWLFECTNKQVKRKKNGTDKMLKMSSCNTIYFV